MAQVGPSIDAEKTKQNNRGMRAAGVSMRALEDGWWREVIFIETTTCERDFFSKAPVV